MKCWALVLLILASCKRAPDHEPPAPVSSAAPVASAPAHEEQAKPPPREPTEIDVAVGGDAIPQVKVLANEPKEIFAGVPACWNKADARLFNLEAPIGERKGLPGDKTILAFASPPSWVKQMVEASHVNAMVVANNHSCDLGPEGLAATVNEAKNEGFKVAGADPDDPWKRVELVEKSGRKVCLVAWTTFLNDKGRKQKGCLEGAAGARVARAELGPKGLSDIHEELGKDDRWAGCDARIAYVHGGREYRAQIRPLMEQAQAASAYVDAVIISHPHVPDGVEAVISPAALTPSKGTPSKGARAAGRSVPVYKSLGNFVSNQGIAWTPGMSVELLDVGGVPDPIRTVWTRVSVIARLRFAWDGGAPELSPPNKVLYGYTLAFTDRLPPLSIKLRELPNGADDPVFAKLRKGPHPFSDLLDGKCRIDSDATPKCDGLKGDAVATPGGEPDSPELAVAPHP